MRPISCNSVSVRIINIDYRYVHVKPPLVYMSSYALLTFLGTCGIHCLRRLGIRNMSVSSGEYSGSLVGVGSQPGRPLSTHSGHIYKGRLRLIDQLPRNYTIIRNAPRLPRFPCEARCENSRSGLQQVQISVTAICDGRTPASSRTILFVSQRSRWNLSSG